MKAILNGVFQRLAKLTTMNDERLKMRIDQIYPEYVDKFRKSKLIEGPAPTFKSILDQMDNPATIEARREKQRSFTDKRNIFFCVGFTRKWPISLQTIFERLKKHHKLKWIRVRVVYKNYPNVLSLLNGDLV